MIALGVLAISTAAFLGALLSDYTNIGAGLAELVKGKN